MLWGVNIFFLLVKIRSEDQRRDVSQGANDKAKKG